MTALAQSPSRGWLTPLNLMLLAVPVAIVLKLAGVEGMWMFVGAGLGIVPLAGFIGKATEALASRVGAGIGGLLNATFGNAAELIIAIVILARGPELYPIVRATLTGSIIGNLLLVLGAAILAGGTRHREQRFNRTAAGTGATLMAIAAAGLLIPSVFYYVHASSQPHADSIRRVENLSEEISVILLLVYGLSLVFSLKTHAFLYLGHENVDAGKSDATQEGEVHWSVGKALGVLAATTAAVAVLSEWLVGAIEPAAHTFGMNDLFIGAIVVAVVGNAAEHFSAIQMAWRNQMDIAVQIAVSSSTQIALFVAPVLVFISMMMGHAHPLDLHFRPIEVVAVVLSVALVALVCHDGESNWLEGSMLLALYVILGLAFYNLPATAH